MNLRLNSDETKATANSGLGYNDFGGSPTHMGKRRSNPKRSIRKLHGYTMVEMTVVLVIIVALTLVAVGRLSSGNGAGSDTRATGALSQLSSVQTSEVLKNGVPSGAAELDGRLPSVQLVVGSSAVAQTDKISLSVSGSVMGAAAITGAGSCWFLRRDFSGETAPTVWSVSESVTCDGQTALATDLEDGRGTTVDEPVLLG